MAEGVVGRMPPNDVQSEYAVLGAMLIDKKAVNEVFEILEPEDFYDNSNKEIFTSMMELDSEGKAIDMITINDKLNNKGSLALVGGPGFIAELTMKVSFTSNVEYYAKIVKDYSLLRQLIGVAKEIAESAYGYGIDVAEIVGTAERKILSIAEGKQSSGFVKIKPILHETLRIIDERSRNKGKLTGLKTGYSELNRYLNGLQKKDLIIIAARPAMGKTAFALNMAVNAAIESEAKVAVFSLEMGKEQLAQRMLGSTGLIELEKLSSGNLENDDWDKLIVVTEKLSETDIVIDDTPGITLTELKAKCRTMKISTGLDLIVIDYLQLMSSDGRSENRQQEISKISRGLKALAKELDCPVIALSQLSRLPDSRSDRKPVISDLRESGAIEQDADIVMLLYRDDYYNQDSEEKGIAEIILAKHRNGPTGTIKLLYKPEYTKFISISREMYES